MTAPTTDPSSDPRWVLHVDLDQFIAAVEVRRRPDLAGLPVVVGGRGDPTERGVVATASYEARAHGVRSGLPLRVAVRKCPDAVFLPHDKPAYEEASAEVMAVLRDQRWGGRPVRVQVLGWDEAFVGPDPAVGEVGWEVAGAPEDLAAQVRAAVLEATGLHASVGIGDTTLQAKTATDLGKPRGTFRLTHETWLPVMGERPVTALWGIGPKTARRLEALGLRTVADLAAARADDLATALGESSGPWLRRLGRGAGTAEVDPTPWQPRAHGRETTFQTDLVERADLEREVRRLAAEAAADIAAEGRPAARVVLKVRLVPFTTLTRTRTLPTATGEADALGDVAVALLDRVDGLARGVRLLGVRLEMTPPEERAGLPPRA